MDIAIAPSRTTALVLAGGGSFGAVQVGMLHALVERGLAVDLVVGASVGAINAAWYAHAPDLEGVVRLESIWRALHRSTVFPLEWRDLLGAFGRRSYLVESSGLRRLFEEHLGDHSIESCVVPLRVIATELFTGAMVCLSRGPLVTALLASCAIPGVFAPVRVGDRELIDGAVSCNTPISAAVDAGAQRIIVLPTGFACSLGTAPTSALGSAMHALTLMIAHQLVLEIERYRSQVEIVTVPPLCPLDASPYDFSEAGALIERGLVQTRRWLDTGGLARSAIPAELTAHTH